MPAECGTREGSQGGNCLPVVRTWGHWPAEEREMRVDEAVRRAERVEGGRKEGIIT